MILTIVASPEIFLCRFRVCDECYLDLDFDCVGALAIDVFQWEVLLHLLEQKLISPFLAVCDVKIAVDGLEYGLGVSFISVCKRVASNLEGNPEMRKLAHLCK